VRRAALRVLGADLPVGSRRNLRREGHREPSPVAPPPVLCKALRRMISEAKGGSCLTCYGTGEVVTESGAESCPDCYGTGRLPGGGTATEWRIRDVERAHRGTGRESEAEVLWLVHELRRSREALLRIVALCEDVGSAEQLALEVKHAANEVLGLYEPEG